jgi:hypothetical protein
MNAMATHSGEALAARSVQKDDLWTLAAFGALAYMIGNVLHEGLGHGGMAWVAGARRITVTSTFMDSNFDTRWILAGGTLSNLVFGVLGFALLRAACQSGLPMRLFLWSMTAFNLLLGTGYFPYSGIAGIGDWAEWMKGLSPAWAWRIGFTVLGIVTYGISARALARELVAITGDAKQGRMRRITWVIYFAGALTACLAGLRNPMGWKLVLISAAASSLGGASALLWIPRIARRVVGAGENATTAVPIPKIPLLWLVAAVLLVAYVWWLGSGITLRFGA